MKKIISLLLSVIFLLSFAPLNIFAMSGSGTESNPYLVSSASDINNIHNDLSGYYKLTNNINMSGITFEPIGNENEGAFTGTIDGAGYTISNLNINLSENKYVGFVGYLEGTIKNLNITNVDAYGYRYVGGLVGYNDGNIESCQTTGCVYGGDCLIDICIGGIAGYNNGQVLNSSNSSTIGNSEDNYTTSANYYMGGIIGYNTGKVLTCENSGNIFGKNTSGGVVGKNTNLVENCTNYANIKWGTIGGICGENGGNINNCYNYGVTDEAGIASYNDGNIIQCINYGNINSSDNAGGIVKTNFGYIYNCINAGTIESNASNSGYFIGGIASVNGYNSARGCGYIYQCYNSGKVIAKTTQYGITAGGIAGTNDCNSQYSSGRIKDCFNSGMVYAYGDINTSWSYSSYAYGIAENSYGDSYISDSINVGVQQSYYGPTKNSSITYNIARDYNNSYHLGDNSSTKENNENIIYYDGIKERELIDYGFSKEKWYIDNKINNGLPTLLDLPRHIDLNKCIVVMSECETEQLNAYIDNTQESVTWISDDTSIATVSSAGIVTPRSIGTCTITATNSTGMKANCLIYVYRKATSMKLTKEEIDINEGQSYDLTTIQSPIAANETVKWYSEDERVATVDQNGSVMTKGKGSTKIHAITTQSNIRAECIVTVSAPISSIKLSSENKTLKLGASDVITATISPADYEGDIAWESSDDSIVSVDSGGIIKANKIGTAYITAIATSGVSAQCKVTVNQPAIRIKLNKSEITTYVGSTYQLSSSVLPLDTTDSVSWESSNSSYATVSSTGLVTGVRPGSTSITARTSNGLTATCNVTIKEAIVEPTSVTLSDTYITLAPEDAKAITATIAPSNATETNLVWTSSDENVAAVNNKGVVTAVSNGYATITVKTTNGYSHQCTVKVVDVTKQAFIAKSTKASAGEIAEYTVSVVKNPGISAYKLSIDYDTDMLEAIDIISNNNITGTLKTNIEDTDRKILNVLWYADEDYSENSDLFTVKFKVKDTAENGKMLPVTLSYNAGDVCNSKHDNLAFFISNTEIEVSDPLPGDVYEDGVLNVHDILLLSRYITGLENLSSRQLIAANLIEDDVVDIKDTVKLAQILLGQPKLMMTPKLISGENNVSPTVTIGSAKINDAKEIDIPVSINNNTGIAGFNFKIDYNVDELEIISITPNTDVITNDFKTNLGNEGENGLLVSWYNAQNINTNGILFTIKAKCKKSYNGISAIGIVSADNNFCDDSPENVLVNYANGEIEYNSFIKENETIENGTYSADLYFDNSYEEKSAVAILALYNKNGQFLGLSSKDITVKPGRVDLSLDYDDADYFIYKLLIWEDMSNLKPLTGVK